jgi:hypothetical protein
MRDPVWRQADAVIANLKNQPRAAASEGDAHLPRAALGKGMLHRIGQHFVQDQNDRCRGIEGDRHLRRGSTEQNSRRRGTVNGREILAEPRHVAGQVETRDSVRQLQLLMRTRAIARIRARARTFAVLVISVPGNVALCSICALMTANRAVAPSF